MKKPDSFLKHDISNKISVLYREMEESYENTAESLGFSCSGCPDNCCDSYFLHHTYSEWLYLWQGLKTLDELQLQRIIAEAARNVTESEAALSRGKRPMIMCPLNLDGRCSLYPYRLMICRLHGVPSSMTRPDGRKINFPGCFRCQEQIKKSDTVTHLDRTRFFKRLVALELELLTEARAAVPRIKLTIAQMIVKGPPVL